MSNTKVDMRSGRREKIKIGSKKKIAFVCSGGAAKAGAFHLGVALALREQGFKFMGGLHLGTEEPRRPDPMEISTYVGSSAGSVICSYLAAGYSLDNIFNSFLSKKATDPVDELPRPLPKLSYQEMFKVKAGPGIGTLKQMSVFKEIAAALMDNPMQALLQLKWLKATGIFSTSGIERYFREDVLPSNRFQDYLPELYIVATQLNHSRKVVFGKRDDIEPPPHDLSCKYDKSVMISQACACSTALPVIFAPYPIKTEAGKSVYYIDGEIRDTLSTHVGIDTGADLVIASYTHQPYHFVKEVGSLTEHGLPAIVIQAIYLLIEKKISHHIHNKKIQRNSILEVDKYCKEQGLSDSVRLKILGILERELHHRLDVDTIYIHPNPNDASIFFGDHFSLSPKRMESVVRSGFRAAIETLRRYEFADKQVKPVLVRTAAMNG